MYELLQMFREGGPSMFAVLALDVCAAVVVPIALIVAIVARVTGKVRSVALVLGGLAVLTSIVPMCAGVGGYLYGMSRVESAVVHADPEMKQTLLDAGEAEASNNLSFGFGTGCACLLPAILALILVPPKPVVYDDF